jgi:hypothetical protein
MRFSGVAGLHQTPADWLTQQDVLPLTTQR